MSVALKQTNVPELDFRESPLMSHTKINQLMYSVLSNDLKFNDLEQKLFKVLQELFCTLLAEVLEQLDEQLMCSAKRQGWEVKDNHTRNIESSFGPLSFSRRYYSKTTTTGLKVYSYLLDEALGLGKNKNLSPRLTEMAIILASENSYRTSSKFLEEMLGVKISHEGIRQAVQEAGEQIAKWDNESLLDNSGKKEVPLLVIEVDEVNVKQ